MIKKIKLTLTTLALSSLATFNPVTAQTTAQINPINYKKEILRSKKNSNTLKYNNIVYDMLKIEGKYAYPDAKTLDAIIDSSKTLITKQNYSEEEAKKLLPRLDSIILSMLLPELNSQNDYCYRTVIPLIAIAKENNLPIYGVLSPELPYGHLFTRWNPTGKYNASNPNDSNNKRSFNWETTNSTAFNDKQEIAYVPLLNKKVIDEEIYLHNLNDKGLLALAHLKMAINLQKDSEYKKAIKECNKSKRLFPKSPIPHRIKGECFYSLKKYKKALKNLTEAIEINPEPLMYIWRGEVFIKLNENEKALREYEEAKKLDPNKELGFYYRSYRYLKAVLKKN